MKPFPLLLGVLAFATAPGAQAQEPGYGSASCVDIVEQTRGTTSFSESLAGQGAVAWAQGYVAGVNVENRAFHKRTVDMSGGRASELWSVISSECRDNPAKSLERVVAEFFAHNMR